MHPNLAELKFYAMYLQGGMTAFDVGASDGMMTLLLSQFQGRLWAFEPDPRSFLKLEATFTQHPRGNVHLNNLALWCESGTVPLRMYDDRHAPWSTVAQRPVESGGVDREPEQILDVPATTVDVFCKNNAIDHIHLLKLDAEGAEFRILQGARRMFNEKRISCVVMEYGRTWWDMGYTPDDVEKFFDSYDFEVLNTRHDQPAFPGRESGYESKYAILVAASPHCAGRVAGIVRAIGEVG
jgi:FkbM family methyltransferase